MEKIKIKKNSGQAPSPERALDKQERKAFDAHLVRGQVMMITVLVLSGVIIGAAAISGILTVRQTRQTADAGNSSKAVFAADAGLEWRLYKLYNDWNKYAKEEDVYKENPCLDCPGGGGFCSEEPEFEDASLETDCKYQGLSQICKEPDSPPCPDYYSFIISSTGKAKDSSYTFSQRINLIK